MFVIWEDQHNLGIGRIVGKSGDIGLVEYFDSPTDVKRPTFEAPLSQLRRRQLPPQTRVYYHDQRVGYWEIGRVVDHVDADVFVRFPNQRELQLHESEVHVRWRRPISDPTSHLSHFLNETPQFAEAREKFVKNIIKQRTAFGGISGFASANIELEPHQYSVIRRVLYDHMQRYMLADEVGLGKTIEAGVLIRQYVLDSPFDHQVVILVPDAIVNQWRDELTTRFHLAHWMAQGTIIVVGHQDEVQLPKLLRYANMIVIDEAHYLSELYSSCDANRRNMYELIRKHALRVTNLLLLTATPVTTANEGFLCILHLLDPVIYKLDDIDGFAGRIAKRQEIAEVVAGFSPDNFDFIPDYVPRLEELFPHDRLLQEKIATLKSILPAIDDPENEDYVTAVQSIRHHLTETYRLHRRILRNRRARLEFLTPERRGVQVFLYTDPDVDILAHRLEMWRENILRIINIQDGELLRANCERLYLEMLEAASSDGHRLSSAAAIASDIIDGLELREDSGSVAGIPTREELLEPLRLLANSTYSRSNPTVRHRAALGAIEEAQRGGDSVIVFCTSPRVADDLATFLRAESDTEVLRDNVATTVGRCRDAPSGGRPWVLICDRAAEEGLNLQGTRRVILHYDLPLSPNRIEQRTGRVDRYGKGSHIKSMVLACADNPPEEAWAVCLRDGFGVFDRSIAGLQYFCQEEMKTINHDVFSFGADQIARATERLSGEQGRTAKELRRLNTYDALESLQDDDIELPEVLDAVDDDWREIEEALKAWTVGAMRFRQEYADGIANAGGPLGGVFRLQYRGPDKKDPTLLSMRTYMEHFDAAIDSTVRQSSCASTFPYAPKRMTALKHGARVLRIGDPFVDEMETLTRCDDRGRVFAMWRHYPRAPRFLWPRTYFKFEFIVDADLSEAMLVCGENGGGELSEVRAVLRRRIDALFHPFFATIWLTEDLNQVQAGDDLKLLILPYRKKGPPMPYRDYNLNPRRWAEVRAKNLRVLEHWEDLCEGAATKAREVLLGMPAYKKNLKKSLRLADEESTRRFAQMQARIAHLSRKDAKIEQERLLQEERLHAALCRGIECPVINIDSVGVVFVSHDGLAEVEDEGR